MPSLAMLGLCPWFAPRRKMYTGLQKETSVFFKKELASNQFTNPFLPQVF
jgi:hypothetical protein